jgi:DNA polymerase III delta prime subunit
MHAAGHPLRMSEAEADADSGGREEIWLEKYRPQTLAEVVGQETITERLQSYVDRNDLSHMLFAGPAGVGKCTTGETPVLTNDGILRMADAVGGVEGFHENDGLSVLTLDGDSFEYTEPSHVFAKSTDRLVDVSTRDGAELTVTPEHRLLVVTDDGPEWREAATLEPGDRVARPLRAPLPDSGPALDWFDEMDGDRTFVHVSEAFARRHDIPYEANLVGSKKQVVRGLRRGEETDAIVDRNDIPRKTVQAAEREFADADLGETSAVCPLSELRDLESTPEEFREHVEAIQYVNPTNNARAEPVTPPWEMTPQLARFMGLAVSEARIERSRVKFYNTDPDLLETFETAAREQFSVETRRGEQKDVPYVAVGSRTLTHYLESCFDVFDGAMDGDGIGSTLLRADEASRRAFLQAVFDAEAHVQSKGSIELTQKRPEMITLLSYLLASFGIPSRRKTERKRATNGSGTERTYHTLYLSNASHLRRFQQEVGFSVDAKAAELSEAVDRTHNPNDDTVPAQRAVSELCDRLYLNKTEYVPDTLNPDTPGRERYLNAVSGVVDAATEKLERVQEARERLGRLRPQIADAAAVPAEWVAKRNELEPLQERRRLAAEVGVSSGRLLEYARGDRTPYAGRARTLLAELDGKNSCSVADVQTALRDIFQSLEIPYAAVADGTGLHSSDVANLLEHDDHHVRSLTRFGTVADRLDEVLSRMASRRTLERLRVLHRLTEADLYFDTVETVEHCEEQRRVYDLTVPGTRNYVAGAVPTVMHNTTAAMAIARELYGEDWSDHFLELNASDERGIDVVRDRIKSFARTSFGGADYRIIFLDEADALTSDAQAALRRTMEQFSNNVRFILSCNYSSQIIDPIQSRCAVFRFSPLPDEAVATQIRKVADTEGIEVTDDGVDALVYAADGDMRKAINGLQAAAVTGELVDEEAVFAVTSTARPEEIREMVTLALDGEFTAARARLDELLTEEGIAGGDIIDQLHRSVWEYDLGDEAAVRVLERIGEVDYRVTEGANERIQLEALLASLALEE